MAAILNFRFRTSGDNLRKTSRIDLIFFGDAQQCKIGFHGFGTVPGKTERSTSRFMHIQIIQTANHSSHVLIRSDDPDNILCAFCANYIMMSGSAFGTVSCFYDSTD
jgi:hypothetical protein